MARNTSVSLGDHFTAFIDEQVRSGRYATASDVVRAGLRLLEDHETRIESLRAALVAGEASGDPHPLDLEAFLRSRRAAREG